MFKNPFSFEGRIRRTEYGLSLIIYFLTAVLMMNVLIVKIESTFILLLYIPILWFIWAQGAKRCHDRGSSGFYQLIPLYVFVLIFAEGEEGQNEYGNDPKDDNGDEEDISQHLL
jgi:uncharacterized membrane protein YhaH (DUF805 family)